MSDNLSTAVGANVNPPENKFTNWLSHVLADLGKNGIFIAQHGSWNRAKKLGYRVLFLSVDPDGKNPKEQVFAGTWLDDQKILGRPADVLQAPDGSLLVADDQTGAIYRISYQK